MNLRIVIAAGAVVVIGALVYGLAFDSRSDSGRVTVKGNAPPVEMQTPPPPLRPSGPASDAQAGAAALKPDPVTHAIPPRPAGPIIEPGTPERFLKSYLEGYVPVEIRKDGTQIFKDIPVQVRMGDGTVKTQLVGFEGRPAPEGPQQLPIEETTPAVVPTGKPNGG